MLGSLSLFRMITPRPGPTPGQGPSHSPSPIDPKPSLKDKVEISSKGRELAQKELSPEEEDLVKKLKERDQHVRMHEQAHLSAAGPYAKGAPQFDFQKGPDQKQYAVGGEVSIDTGKTGKPENDLAKAKILKAAASAPADPSAQDQKVAAAASQMESEALAKLQKKSLESPTYSPNARANSNSVLGSALDLSA